jgi:hypothetical protein
MTASEQNFNNLHLFIINVETNLMMLKPWRKVHTLTKENWYPLPAFIQYAHT